MLDPSWLVLRLLYQHSALVCLLQAYAALLNAALKCGEGSLAVDVYRQMKGQGMPLPIRLFHTLIDVLVKIGKWQVSFAALLQVH